MTCKCVGRKLSKSSSVSLQNAPPLKILKMDCMKEFNPRVETRMIASLSVPCKSLQKFAAVLDGNPF